MDKRYLVYEKETGICVNVIIWDGETEYNPGEGLELEIVPAGSLAWAGWTRVSKGNWEPPEEIEQPQESELPEPLAEPDFDETT